MMPPQKTQKLRRESLSFQARRTVKTLSHDYSCDTHSFSKTKYNGFMKHEAVFSISTEYFTDI